MILASITLGTTIYVASNNRERVRPEDVVEIVLGTYERCLATQYSSNSYYVTPPSFVRSWYSNSYEQNSTGTWVAVLHTNIFTNVFGVRLDHDMLASLDNTIKALVPYYCDANTVYDGTTNIVMLTVTGLWASLGIGDHTNQFTAVPAWVGTNGVANAATYGAFPWRIYKQNLEERYKVLNALQYRINDNTTKSIDGYGGFSGPNIFSGTNWNHAKLLAEGDWPSEHGDYVVDDYRFVYGLFAGGQIFGAGAGAGYGASIVNGIMNVSWTISTTNVKNNIIGYLKSHSIDTWRGNPSSSNYYDGGLGLIRDAFSKVFNVSETNNVSIGILPEEKPAWCPEPTLTPPIYDYYGGPSASISYGFGFNDSDLIVLINYNFSYCANKYW